MILLDTNVIIYAVRPGEYQRLRAMLDRPDQFFASYVSQVEALGYWRTQPPEEARLELFFDGLELLPIESVVARQAVLLRQSKKMQISDAIIAATALVHKLELWTHDTTDFADIKGLRLFDPLADSSTVNLQV